MTFDEALAFGVDGEHRVSEMLQRRGVKVLPLYQFENHDRAPMLLFRDDGLSVERVLPDLTCWKGERVFFAEIKRKQRWVRHVRPLETGLNLRLWEEYTVVQQETGCPVWLFFLHEVEPPLGLFAGSLDRLSPHGRWWDGRNESTGEYVRPPMVLFPHSALLEMSP